MVKGTSHIRVKDVEMGILVWIMQKRPKGPYRRQEVKERIESRADVLLRWKTAMSQGVLGVSRR